MMHAPNPPSRPQWTGKQSLLTADNCISGLSSFCRQNSKQQNLVQTTNTGITPKSKNSDFKKEQRSKTTNWIEVNRKWPGLYANITTLIKKLLTYLLPVRRWIRREIRNTEITEN